MSQATAVGVDEAPENTRLIVIINNTNKRFIIVLLLFDFRSSFIIVYLIEPSPVRSRVRNNCVRNSCAIFAPLIILKVINPRS